MAGGGCFVLWRCLLWAVRGTLVFGVLAAAARGGVVSKGWEKLRDAKTISIYYAVRCVDSILHPLDAIDHWTQNLRLMLDMYVNLQEYTRCGHSHHNVAPRSTLLAPQMWQILYVFW